MLATKIIGEKEIKGKLMFRYKNISLIIVVILMFSLAYYRNNVPVITLDPSRVKEGEVKEKDSLMFNVISVLGSGCVRLPPASFLQDSLWLCDQLHTSSR